MPLCFVNRADPGIRAAQKHIALARQEGLTICVDLESAEICACYWPAAKETVNQNQFLISTRIPQFTQSTYSSCNGRTAPRPHCTPSSIDQPMAAGTASTGFWYFHVVVQKPSGHPECVARLQNEKRSMPGLMEIQNVPLYCANEFGVHAVENICDFHDLHATLLHQCGLDHTRLTYRNSGRDFRLTDMKGRVVHEILQ